jgi:putative phage-type endonuclease
MEDLQRTVEWHAQRHGKFTASQIVKILGVRGIGETGKTYAIDKAIEELYGEMEENYISYDMQKGIDTEPLAFEKFKSNKELEFLEVKNCGFFAFEDHAGASPDGLVSDNAILEIKCPKSTTFFKLIATNEVDKTYYAQMQMQMLCTNLNKAYFFNYLIHEGTEYHHEIIIYRDEDFIDNIKDRLKEVIKIKKEYIELINKNKQF